MTRRSAIVAKEARALRAVLLCLAVLAQLMLPAVLMRAEAIAANLCVTSGGADSGPSKFHQHGKQCAHCRLHKCSPTSPPTATAILVERADFPPPALSEAATPRGLPFRAQPPPTGPPPA
jgi:Protein of unknown function (DUF2946)